MSPGWDAVWDARQLDLTHGPILQALLAAGGRDTAFGTIEEESWLAFVRGFASRVGLGPGGSVFDVGCGAGAFLYDLYRTGCVVSGIDRSRALVTYASQVMPEGKFEVAEASELPTEPPADVVVCCEAFPYFPSLDYAQRVIRRMAAKAGRAVAVIGAPDLAKKEAALALRQELAGGADAYAARYRGLEHLYYDRGWLAEQFAGCGLEDVQIEDQGIEGYGNGPYRFNCFGFVPG